MVARLLDWDEQMRNDIDLTPDDVWAALAMPRSNDPSPHLGRLSSERRSPTRATAHERVIRRASQDWMFDRAD